MYILILGATVSIQTMITIPYVRRSVHFHMPPGKNANSLVVRWAVERKTKETIILEQRWQNRQMIAILYPDQVTGPKGVPFAVERVTNEIFVQMF